ncbi:hypothetical protein I4U23_027378 [Adineta vaga]|nr:hypothetical protein I4U23_027378 [Adineta vaga]
MKSVCEALRLATKESNQNSIAMSFISTSRDPSVSTCLVESSADKLNTVDILFKMFIHPSVSTIPFASIRDRSQLNKAEILYNSLMDHACCEGEKALDHINLAVLKAKQNHPQKAIDYW